MIQFSHFQSAVMLEKKRKIKITKNLYQKSQEIYHSVFEWKLCAHLNVTKICDYPPFAKLK